MKYFKKHLAIFMAFFMFTFFIVPVAPNTNFSLVAKAHSGRTDSKGGHHDYKNVSGLGSYHYHCGGRPAHLHPNGKCPYSASSNSSAKIKLSKTSATLVVGKTLQLKLKGTSKKAVWTSSKKSVASVNSKGKITAKKAGTATITAKVGSKKYKCKITVKPLTLNKTKATLYPGQSVSLKLDTKSKIKWSSSNKKIASVSSKGKVSAKQTGKATITATVGKKKYKCSITVTKAPGEGITITTIDFNPIGNEINFQIKNNTGETVTIYDNLKAFNDDYEYYGSMTLPFSNMIQIRSGESRNVTFLDFSFSGRLIYYTQRFTFRLNVGNKQMTCYAEYNYSDSVPYIFSFK